MASLTILEAVSQWLTDLKADRAETTIARYASVLQRFSVWCEMEHSQPPTLHDLNPILLVGYRNSLQQTEQPATVNIHVSALRSWGKWLEQQKLVDENPTARLKLVKRQQPVAPRALTPGQVNALLRETQQGRYPARDYAIVQMLVQTGMRIGECTALHWGDITFGEKSGQVLIRSGKGNKARLVPLNGSVRQALAEYVAIYLSVLPTLKAVAAAWSTTNNAFRNAKIWQSQKGDLTLVSMDRLIKEYIRGCARRGLLSEDTTVHQLRHTFATRYLAAHAADLVGLAHLLGHTSLDATKIYVQPTAAQLADRVDRIDLNAYYR